MSEQDMMALLVRRLPPGFERRVVTLTPGESLAHDPATWWDALVVVTCGQVELEGLAGTRILLGTGAVLTLAGLPLRALHSVGTEPAVLVAVARLSTATASRGP